MMAMPLRRSWRYWLASRAILPPTLSDPYPPSGDMRSPRAQPKELVTSRRGAGMSMPSGSRSCRLPAAGEG